MKGYNLAPDISILMDDTEFKCLVDEIHDNQKKIETYSNKLSSLTKGLDKSLLLVARKLLEYPLATYKLEAEVDSGVELHDRLDERFINEKDCYLRYNIVSGYDAEVTLVFDDEDTSVVSFPLSFAIRADWLAKLEVYAEATKIKQNEHSQAAKVQEEEKELATLRTLLEKYKDKI